MFKLRFFFFFLLFPVFFYSQIGIGTPIPNVNASLHLAEENKTLILNHVSDKSAITNPYDGMIFYDVTERCFRGYANGEFTDCFGVKPSDPVVRVDGPGFKGTYVRGQELTDATYEITVTNNTFKDVTLGFHVNDLKITGVGITADAGIDVDAVYLAGNTGPDVDNFDLVFPAGASKTIIYKLIGTPVAPYTQLLGEWNKITLNYDDVVDIEYKFDCKNGVLEWDTNSALPLDGFEKGKTYSGTYNISYNVDATGFDFAPYTYTFNGLTISANSFSGQASGIVMFEISGVYSGNDKEFITLNVYNSCNVNFGYYYKDCNSLLKAYKAHLLKQSPVLPPDPLLADGVYKIDVDGPGGLSPLDCYCDMTTDGGGWTLVLNYNHNGGTNPELLVRTNDLPLLSTASLGVDESEIENSKYWGHFSNSLASKFDFNEVRFYGISNSMTSEIIKPAKTALGNDGRVMNFVTNHSNVINYIKTGSGSMSGIQKLITPTNIYGYRMLDGHTTHLPYVADSFMSNQGDYSLTFFPFYKETTITWGIRPYFNGYYRWEVDEWANSYMYSTHHQVWIR